MSAAAAQLPPEAHRSISTVTRCFPPSLCCPRENVMLDFQWVRQRVARVHFLREKGARLAVLKKHD